MTDNYIQKWSKNYLLIKDYPSNKDFGNMLLLFGEMLREYDIKPTPTLTSMFNRSFTSCLFVLLCASKLSRAMISLHIEQGQCSDAAGNCFKK